MDAKKEKAEKITPSAGRGAAFGDAGSVRSCFWRAGCDVLRRERSAENFRRILEYNACRLCVLTQYGRLLLVGEGIRIVSYSGEEMRVEGRIDQATFQ